MIWRLVYKINDRKVTEAMNTNEGGKMLIIYVLTILVEFDLETVF